MKRQSELLPETKRIALIAHDNRKQDLLEWARFNRGTLAEHRLFGTGTTGRLLQDELDVEVYCFQRIGISFHAPRTYHGHRPPKLCRAPWEPARLGASGNDSAEHRNRGVGASLHKVARHQIPEFRAHLTHARIG